MEDAPQLRVSNASTCSSLPRGLGFPHRTRNKMQGPLQRIWLTHTEDVRGITRGYSTLTDRTCACGFCGQRGRSLRPPTELVTFRIISKTTRTGSCNELHRLIFQRSFIGDGV